ncbi:hypothetical protein [Streptomyces sp. NBC_01483]|uniref:hypothetical protein n=1 Tax=Streptomyces sp. NBC_01483 TaxID=2903883 RepID=UPI002E324CCC|nr:hypothetical protein [Streptomyces sp. NBC_01483]
MLLLLDSNGVLVIALDLLGLRQLSGQQRVRSRIARRHGAAHRRQSYGCRGDLIACSSGEVAQGVRVGDERTAPATEGITRFADPVHVFDVTAEFRGRRLDGVPCIPQGLARGFQILRVRLLNQVEHLVEIVALEVRTAVHGMPVRGAVDRRTQGVEQKSVEEAAASRPLFYTPSEVREGVLVGDPIQVGLVLIVGHRHNLMPVLPSAVCSPSP